MSCLPISVMDDIPALLDTLTGLKGCQNQALKEDDIIFVANAICRAQKDQANKLRSVRFSDRDVRDVLFNIYEVSEDVKDIVEPTVRKADSGLVERIELIIEKGSQEMQPNRSTERNTGNPQKVGNDPSEVSFKEFTSFLTNEHNPVVNSPTRTTRIGRSRIGSDRIESDHIGRSRIESDRIDSSRIESDRIRRSPKERSPDDFGKSQSPESLLKQYSSDGPLSGIQQPSVSVSLNTSHQAACPHKKEKCWLCEMSSSSDLMNLQAQKLVDLKSAFRNKHDHELETGLKFWRRSMIKY